MNQLKIGTFLIVLGDLLYLAPTNPTSNIPPHTSILQITSYRRNVIN